MNVLIKDFNGFNTSIKIEPNDTIEQIKDNISKLFNIPKGSQQLFLKDKQLDDNKIVKDYNIIEGVTLELKLKENYIKINAVNVMGKTMPFYLKKSDTIEAIKIKIEEREGIPYATQKLVLDPNNTKQILEDSKKIEEYNIKNEERIHIFYNN